MTRPNESPIIRASSDDRFDPLVDLGIPPKTAQARASPAQLLCPVGYTDYHGIATGHQGRVHRPVLVLNRAIAEVKPGQHGITDEAEPH